jgi:outer membrane protein assembly factor BamB
MLRLASILTIAATATVTLAAPDAQNAAGLCWPQFRGPNAQGVAPDRMKLPVHFSKTEHVLWKTPLAPGHSSPCVWDDRIFLTSFDPQARKLETICLDRHKGDIVWRRAAPTTAIEKGHKFHSPAVATPATDGERVYVYFGSFGLLCYDMAGTELWQKALPAPKTIFGTGTSPIVAGDLLLLNCEFKPDPCLLALEARSGQPRWKKSRNLVSAGGPVEGYATPIVWHHDGTDEVILHGRMGLTAYDLNDGAERWHVTATSSASNTPVVGDSQLFLAAHGFGSVAGEVQEPPSFDVLLKKYDKNRDGQISPDEFPADLYVFQRLDIPGTELPMKFFFRRIDTDHDGQISRQEWERFLELRSALARQQLVGLMAVKPGGKGDVTKSHVLWREERAICEVPSPLYYRGRVYMVRDAGLVSCLDAATGKLVYRERLGPGGAYFSSPVAGDGKIYAASKNGVVVVFAAGDRFQVLARNDLGETIQATPALAGGKIYVRTEKALYAFGE